jgi:hypothetical protein
MRQNTILKKAREVLAKNKRYQEAVASYNETAKRITHWEEAKDITKIIFQWNDENKTVILSNEGNVHLTYDGSTELLYGLDEDFKKAGLFVEAYDPGTFIITEE